MSDYEPENQDVAPPSAAATAEPTTAQEQKKSGAENHEPTAEPEHHLEQLHHLTDHPAGGASAYELPKAEPSYPDAPETDGAPDEIFVSNLLAQIYCQVKLVIYAPTDGSSPGKDVTAYFAKAFAQGIELFHGGAEKIFDDFYPLKAKELRVWFDPAALAEVGENTFALGRKPKSLFMCIVTVNPFHQLREANGGKDEFADDEDAAAAGRSSSPDSPTGTAKPRKGKFHAPHTGQTFDPIEATETNPGANFQDDSFLLEGGGLFGHKNAPNTFQKLIEMLLRIKARGLTVLPPDCLVAAKGPDAHEPWNYFAGHKLVEDKFFTSPDHDELYFKIHADRKVLLEFAEKQALTLRTNPYSFGASAGMIYTKKLDEELRQSVLGFMTHFGDDIKPEEEFCKGKLDKKTGEYEAWGFWVEVPQKMRLSLRMLREGWVFGGCGLQLDEMKAKGTFLLNYFPVHNEQYQKAYGIDEWAALSTFFNPCKALKNSELALIHYFGESIAIYFSWLREYILYLLFPLVIGFIGGVLQEAETGRAISGAVFSFLMIIWGVAWIRKWQRSENRFSVRWGQDVEAQQELVRDEFEYDFKKLVDVRSIYTLDFEFPLTMQRLPDGTMVELVFPTNKRNFRRYLVSYPFLVLWACAMVACLFFIEWYRHRPENLGHTDLQIGASILSSLMTIIFAKIAAIFIDLFNDFENCRTDQEYENELVLKSFLFNFVATYFAVITIAIWPDIDNSKRIEQLREQMVTQQVIMPFVGNFIELIVPKIMTNLQKRSDTLGGFCTAVCSYFCCCCCCSSCCDSCNYAEKKVPPPKNDRMRQGVELWKQAQRGRYTSTSADYLEITIQYGYMMMFAAVFPWAGVAAFFNNLIEIRVDSYKLLNEFQRPIARTTPGIGAWNEIFWILTGLSIVTNSYYITVISPTPTDVRMKGSLADLLEYFSFLQYFLVIAVLILGVVRQTESPSVKKNAVKAGLLNDKVIQEYVKKQLSMTPAQLAKDRKVRQCAIDATTVEEPCCVCC